MTDRVNAKEGQLAAHRSVIFWLVTALKAAVDVKVSGKIQRMLLEESAEYEAQSETVDDHGARAIFAAVSSEFRAISEAISACETSRPKLSVIIGGKGDDDESPKVS